MAFDCFLVVFRDAPSDSSALCLPRSCEATLLAPFCCVCWLSPLFLVVVPSVPLLPTLSLLLIVFVLRIIKRIFNDELLIFHLISSPKDYAIKPTFNQNGFRTKRCFSLPKHLYHLFTWLFNNLYIHPTPRVLCQPIYSSAYYYHKYHCYQNYPFY